MKYLTLVIGILAIIISIYDSNSWADLRANYLGFIVGFALIYNYYERHKSSQKTAK